MVVAWYRLIVEYARSTIVIVLVLVRSQGLAAFLKAIGFLIPLMDAEYANYYTREVMLILIREFQSPDEEMKKIVLKVLRLNTNIPMPNYEYCIH